MVFFATKYAYNHDVLKMQKSWRALFIVPQRRGYSRSFRADSVGCWSDEHLQSSLFNCLFKLSQLH